MTEQVQAPTRIAWVLRLGPLRRISIALGMGLLCYALVPGSLHLHTRLLACWDLGALTYLVLAWTVILHADAKQTQAHTRKQDPGTRVIYLLIIGAACASIVALGFVVGPIKHLESWPKVVSLVLAVLALILSWLLIHTVFTIHYARCYYDPAWHASGDAHGMAFPNDRRPDYLDFAYYSFVVGMTSQVSDVQTTTRGIRRLTLVHGVLSFVFNIAVLALAMNIIANAI